MIKRIAIPILISTILSGCAAPINRHTAENYYQAGESAMALGDLQHASEMFSRALINVRLGDMGPAVEGQVLGKLGRVYGNLCQFDEAERAFSDSILAYTSAYGERSPRLFSSKMEIAQFSYDIGRYEKAVVYFDQAFPLGIAILEAHDPEGFVSIMTDYADALTKIGKIDAANQALSKATEAKNKASSVELAKVKNYVRYPSKCGKAPMVK